MRTSLILVFLIAVKSHCFGQSFFPKAGMAASWISTSDMSFSKSLNDDQDKLLQPGFTAGFGFNIPLEQGFSIQPELSFIRKGTIAKLSGRISGLPDDSGVIAWENTRDIKINYVELPVLFKWAFGKHQQFFVNAGPALALGLGGTSTITYVTEYYQSQTQVYRRQGRVLFSGEEWQRTLDDERFRSKIDVGLQIGAGALIIKRFMVDLRYTNGFSNLYPAEPTYENNSTNRSLQMTVGYVLNL